MGDITVPGKAKKRNEGIENELFYVTLMIGEKRYSLQSPLSAPNKESVAAVMSAVVAANLPHVTGFELYRHNAEYEHNREFLMLCPVMEMLTHLSPLVQQAVGRQVLKAAVPVVGAKEAGENLQKMFDELKKSGAQVS